jgi:hypothetical protein
MRALTLTQPWCGLVASGIKLIENRPRPVIRNAEIVRGPVPIALHASRAIDETVYDRIAEIAPELHTFVAGVPTEWYRLSRITSAVIAVAMVTDVVYVGGCSPEHIATICAGRGIPEQARWMFGPTSYVFRDAQALATPVPCRGWQGFWNLTSRAERERGVWSAVERDVRAQLPSAGGP